MCLYVCMCHMCAGTQRPEERVGSLEARVTVSHDCERPNMVAWSSIPALCKNK